MRNPQMERGKLKFKHTHTQKNKIEHEENYPINDLDRLPIPLQTCQSDKQNFILH